jgi:hypothetical protein
VYAETSRTRLRQVRQEVEGFYTENLLPRDAVKFTWALAGKEQDIEIQDIYQQHRDLQERNKI